MGLPNLNLLKGATVRVKQILPYTLKVLFFASLVLNVAACSSDYLPSQEAIEEKLNVFETQKVTCPATRILREGDTYLLTEEQSSSETAKAIARITTVKISCKLAYQNVEEKNPLSKFAILATDVEISILYLSELAEEQAMIEPLPYFVALVNRFGKITTKKVFEAEGPLASEDISAQRIMVENILVNIPIDHLDEAEGYEMLVGFQLSEQQMKHVRKRGHK
tara:strand:+ start:351 stop:1016 length:666 start_codon:yes stop_codon:yes gene_type:complete